MNGLGGSELCGKWMPVAETACALKLGHAGNCRTPEAVWAQGDREQGILRRHAENVKFKLKSYGLTQERFDWFLQQQQRCCAMCHHPFVEGQRINIDHDHACCPGARRSCGKCVRGLLCLTCNAALGRMELRYEMARAYLKALPLRRLRGTPS